MAGEGLVEMSVILSSLQHQMDCLEYFPQVLMVVNQP